ncbi:MAG: aldo/keto reductase [Oscillospiraceae bacterium]|jgi:predicted aldo/keto reductase-like oxidoreductase|nr:aldo/keto reductase [Oscillospiraceae bacterium]
MADKKLGFGYMRLPRKDGKFDEEAVNEMVDTFLARGYTYFDTAFVYEGSEEALSKSLVKRYPRDSFSITTKLAIFGMTRPEQQREQFDISLKRLQVDFVDYYFIHGLGGDSIKLADTLDTWGYLRKMKEEGRTKHIGFSFHGTPEELDEVLTKHPETELVQLQINYLDWDNPEVKSRELYEVAHRHGKPVSIMEPTKGGLLAGEQSTVASLLKKANPDVSVASWAFRYVGGLDGIKVVLSGMENIDQVNDNADTFDNFKQLTEGERALIAEAVEIINATPRIPCTSCHYCTAHCPKKIAIPMFIKIYNDFLTHRDKNSTGYSYALFSGGSGPADCVKCRQCEKHCPQHIEISDVMTKIDESLGEVTKKFVTRTEG